MSSTVHALSRLLCVAVAATGLLACSSDPEMWEGISQGLAAVSDQAEWERANCYWAPPPGIPLGANQKYCPGDVGYRDLQMPTSYYRDRARDDRRDRRDERREERREERRRDKD